MFINDSSKHTALYVNTCIRDAAIQRDDTVFYLCETQDDTSHLSKRKVSVGFWFPMGLEP